MRGAEWSLILFTLLAQLAVGMFVVIAAVNTLSISKSNSLAAREMLIRILISVVIVMILAVLASFLHIGRPKSAALAVNHFSRSWLSREIVFVLLFTALAGMSLALHYLSAGSPLFRERFAVITGVIGIITIISMARVYMLATVPAWNTIVTPIQFIGSSLILGCCGTMFLIALSGGSAGSGDVIREIAARIIPVLLFLLAVNLIAFLVHLFTLPGAGIAGMESFRLLTATHMVPLILRLSLFVVSILLLCVLLFMETKTTAPSVLLILCFVVVISEILGRYLFYASYSRVGI